MTEAEWWTCGRWGALGGPDSDDPRCDCAGCQARRWDRMSKAERKETPELRPQPTRRARSAA